jgi:hypothetical protein
MEDDAPGERFARHASQALRQSHLPSDAGGRARRVEFFT